MNAHPIYRQPTFKRLVFAALLLIGSGCNQYTCVGGHTPRSAEPVAPGTFAGSEIGSTTMTKNYQETKSSAEKNASVKQSSGK